MTQNARFARLEPVPIHRVQLDDQFWKPCLQRNREDAIPLLYDLLESHGVLNNFRRLHGTFQGERPFQGERRGYLFTDSDLYKWMEAAALALISAPSPSIEGLLDQAIRAVLPAQGPDGYLNTWFVDEKADQRWTNLAGAHELYCAGHLIQAGIAHFRATGQRLLLDAAIRFADYIDREFRVGGRPGAPGHPQIEMALVDLFRLTGDRRYLLLGEHFLDQRGVVPRSEIRGHAVRACYFISGATDVFLETGREDYLPAITSQWQDVNRKVYLTGGVGGRYSGEAIGNAYELPNERAYAETCAAIGFLFWNWRLLQIQGDARYADWLERVLYNGFLAGVSLSGSEYFYVNPLACSGKPEVDPWYAWANKSAYQRKPWYDCTCCPPNVQRVLASLPGYFYSSSAEGLWVNLYATNSFHGELANGLAVRLSQETDYPYDGYIRVVVSPERPEEFSLFLRIPGWARSAEVQVNGNPVQGVQPGAYLPLSRIWQPGDVVTLNLPMPVETMVGNERLGSNRGRAAIQRGPVVYCLEGIDHEGRDVRQVQLCAGAGWQARSEPGLLGGITTLHTQGEWRSLPEDAPLYSRLNERLDPPGEPIDLHFIPYYAWANRGASSMAVWIPYRT